MDAGRCQVCAVLGTRRAKLGCPLCREDWQTFHLPKSKGCCIDTLVVAAQHTLSRGRATCTQQGGDDTGMHMQISACQSPNTSGCDSKLMQEGCCVQAGTCGCANIRLDFTALCQYSRNVVLQCCLWAAVQYMQIILLVLYCVS